MYIDERKIVKIGGDVILVDVKCDSSSGGKRPPSHCPPPCPPQYPPNYPHHYGQQKESGFSSEYYASPQLKGDSDEY